MTFLAMILAQTTTPAGSPGGSPAGPTTAPPTGMAIFPIALMMAFVVFMIMSSRSQRKREQRERDDMHARLSKNDRVLTIGGVVGTVINVREDEVVLKVDESTNTKMTFVKSAIQRIISDDKLTPDAR